MLRLAAPLLRSGGALVLRKPYASEEMQVAASLMTSAWSELYTIPLSQDEDLAWVLVVALRDAQAIINS
jgi:hypothetical protein